MYGYKRERARERNLYVCANVSFKGIRGREL